ncbi:MAG: hydrogen peroxide-inducible genes activator, partial [Chitinophagaceae bacterium]
DRSKQPVVPTEAGLSIVEHAKKILVERDSMNEMLHTRKGIISGIAAVPDKIRKNKAVHILPI